MTPIFMGSAYGSGAYFFTRVAVGQRWNTVSAGVLSAAIFAGSMLAVTFVHFGKFNHGNAPILAATAFYGWTVVYIVAPFAVAWLWWRNEHTDSRRPESGDPLVPGPVRTVAGVMSAAAIVAGGVFILSPSTANDVWAWKLTPLTAGVVGSFTIQVGVGAGLLARDERWSSWRVLLQTFVLATVLLLIGTARIWNELDHSRVSTWGFVAGLIGFALAILLLFRTMEKRGSHPAEAGLRPA